MIFLFIHQNFPGQYRRLIRYLADQPGNTVYFITQNKDVVMEGVKKLIYQVEIPVVSTSHPYSAEFDLAVRTGAAVAQVCQTLEQQRIIPDLVTGHCGWGETLFVKDIFPNTPVLSYFEFYYHFAHVDVNFDPEYPTEQQHIFQTRTRNAVALLSFDASDWGNSPTHWQRELHPPEIVSRITTIHEGVDTDIAKPDPTAWLRVKPDDQILTCSDEVITYVARNLEPYRGFHIFMRAIKEVLQRRPKAHVVIVGGDDVSYGTSHPSGENFQTVMLRELGPEFSTERVHFLGQVPYDTYLSVLQISSAHIYLTYPFVLSWSFIEAMACGCAIIGSDTPPVLEVLKDGENGLVVDFFSPTKIADCVDALLDNPGRAKALRAAARETAVKEFDFKTVILPRWLGLADDLMNGRRPKLDLTGPS